MTGGRPRSALRWALLAVGLLLAAIAFLPWGSWLGAALEGEAAAYARAVRGWLLWLAIAVPASVVIALAFSRRLDVSLQHSCRRIADLPAHGYSVSAALVMLALAIVLSDLLFSRNPHLVDTVAQLFQAKIFARGRLTVPAPADMEFFAASHLVEIAGRWFSQYPPGHPSLLAVGVVVGAPWIINPLFAAGTLLLLYATGRRLIGEDAAKLAVVLLIVSPFALFMSASYMNHVTLGFFLTLALYAAVRTVEGVGQARWPVLMGLALAVAATIRPLESLAWGLWLGAWILLHGGLRPAIVAGLVGFVGVLPLLAYNSLTTGHPLRFGYTLLWGTGHGLGFHTDPWGQPFTPAISFANTALDFQRLNVSLFGWPFPSLVFVVIAIAVAGLSERASRPGILLTGLLFAGPIAYFFYWHRDNYLGPRFLYSSLTPTILLTSAGIVWVDSRLGRWRSAFRLMMIGGVLYGLTIHLPESAGRISGMEPEMKLHPEKEVERLGVDDAVAFVKVGWGSRLVSRLWGWGVPASEAEQSFRLVDGCRLQTALDEADSLAKAGSDSARVRAGLRERLERWRSSGLPVAKDLLPDPSVQVDTTLPLPRQCYLQVLDDQAGFTLYGTLIWRNDPLLERGVVYARYLEPDRNARLLQRYPGRPAYLYAPVSPERGAATVFQRLGGVSIRSKEVERERGDR